MFKTHAFTVPEWNMLDVNNNIFQPENTYGTKCFVQSLFNMFLGDNVFQYQPE